MLILILIANLIHSASAEPERTALPPRVSPQSANNLTQIHPRGFYPRGGELADGTLLVAFDQCVEATKAISIVQRTGDTWDNYLRVTEAPASEDLANPFLLAHSNGTLLVAFRHNVPRKGIYGLELCASSDLGGTWDFRSSIVTGTTGLWEPFLLELPDGTLHAYYASHEGISPDQRVEMKASSDCGKTWGPPVTVAYNRGSRDGMPGVVQLPNGTLYAVFEAYDLDPYHFIIRAVRSTDNGNSWSSDRELVYKPTNPVETCWSAGAPSVTLGPNGEILISFQTDENVVFDRGTASRDPTLKNYRYLTSCVCKCIASLDEGKSWSQPVTLAGSVTRPALWNSLFSLKSGTVFALLGIEGSLWLKEMSFSKGALTPVTENTD